MLNNTENNKSINLTGATNESNDQGKIDNIVVPNHQGQVSHIAVDIGGSMAKIVYFTTNEGLRGGRLNFEAFETDNIDKFIRFIESLVSTKKQLPSSNFSANQTSSKDLKERLNHDVSFQTNNNDDIEDNSIKFPEDSPTYGKPIIKATGGGAHLFKDKIEERVKVKVQTEDEMECLITENENPVFESIPKEDMFPYMLVNIGSGVSIIKVTSETKYERISGTSLGGGTFWGLLHLLTGASKFDDMLELSKSGDNSKIDMMVGDIYGTDYDKIGLKATAIASTMGGVYRKNLNKTYNDADIARSLLYMVSNSIGQIAYLNAQLHGINKIYFGGYFIRGHRLTMHTLSYAINFWSKGTMNARFMRHEGFLGAVGAFIKADPSILPDKPAHKARGGSITENFIYTQGLAKESISGLGTLDRLSSKLLPLPQLILCSHNPHPLFKHQIKNKAKRYSSSINSEGFNYNPDTFDLLNNVSLREKWISNLENNTENIIQMANKGKLSLNNILKTDTLIKFQKMYLEKLQTAKLIPSAFGKLSVRILLNLREQSLSEVGCTDLFLNTKILENESSLALLPNILKNLDDIKDTKELITTLIKGMLIGNMFDWGSNEIQKMIQSEQYTIDFKIFQDKIKFESSFNNAHILVDKLLTNKPYKKALIFVDNAGADTFLGVLPFARFLLSQGTSVILAANSQPALNDITFDDLMNNLIKVAQFDEIINKKINDGSLVVIGTGSSNPCLDLSRLNERLVLQSHDVDFIIIVGAGRAIITNFYAMFSVDSLKVTVFKSSITAEPLGGKEYDSVYTMLCSKSKFRPCIDLHSGKVKQIVGGTLTDDNESLKENFVALESSAYYANLYKTHSLTGGHVIMLGPGNEQAAIEALSASPGILQIGGGINIDNAQKWLDYGASKVIVTSWLFTDNKFDFSKLERLEKVIGKDKLVVDLRKHSDSWVVAINKWQTKTDLEITEGIEDLQKVNDLSNGKVDLTIGSALDIFGGSKIKFSDCVKWNS
ncbi:hypothetical protein BB561_002540 [Smittium simulii]|uniref:1-(5-phosphoribosyl)-5-[(5-phosphoribosylamino)methylideneamino] imidazole-4-carboxamide isomerase n=1 Tax=Smittium simulii TaxID=133385 RepID=A0A2T9YQ10_9FUNG|nr:hypothetical protein BB561_002540 [Smittium simulii]